MSSAIVLLSLVGSCVAASGTFNASTFLITMHAKDPLSNGLDLSSAMSASQLTGFTLFNANSDITFGQYDVGSLISGVQGGEEAAFADLGPESSIVGNQDCNTVGGGQNFASLHIANGTVRAIDTCGSSNSCPQTFREIPGLEHKLATVQSTASIVPQAGHVYILRIVNGDGNTRAMFKIMVVSVHPQNTSVTFRYGIMDFAQSKMINCCDPDNVNRCPPAPRNLALVQGPPGPRGSAVVPSASSAPSPDSPTAQPVPVGVGGVVAAATVSTVASVSVMALGWFFCIGPRRNSLLVGTPSAALLKSAPESSA